MKKLVIVAALVAGALLGSASAARGEVLANVSDDVSGDVPVDCAGGEIVAFAGTVHTVTALTSNDNGTMWLTRSQPQGLRGVGLTSGSVWQGVGVTITHTHTRTATDASEFTFVNVFRFVGRAGQPTLSLHETLHVVQTATGAVSVSRDALRLTCD